LSPRSAAQFEALRADAQDRLERAALRVFARSGYAAATVRDVAREAGVAQGLLYNYYRGKHELLAAIFRRSVADVAASFARGRRRRAAGRAPRAARTRVVRDRARAPGVLAPLYGVRQQPDVLAALGDGVRAFTDGVRATLEAHLARRGGPRRPPTRGSCSPRSMASRSTTPSSQTPTARRRRRAPRRHVPRLGALPPMPAWLDTSAYPFAARRFDSADGRMHYVDEGDGPPS
jgi:AcrR family transcriptional regulator